MNRKGNDLKGVAFLLSSVAADYISDQTIVVDGGWARYGLASEIIASVAEKISFIKCLPQRLTTKNSPAPTSKVLEQNYYIQKSDIIDIQENV